MPTLTTIPCSGRGCTNEVPVGDVTPSEAWCSPACAGGVARVQSQRPASRRQATPAGPERPARVNTPEAPSRPAERPTGPQKEDLPDRCRKRGHPWPQELYVTPAGARQCKACVRELRAARKER